jgi:large subunit ribosomal protein L24
MFMIQSSQPRKMRRFRYNAPLHCRQKFTHAHVSKELAKKLGIKARSISLRKGDTVKVQAGGLKGRSGKVSAVNLDTGKIYIEGIVKKNAKGKELPIPVHPSSVYLTDLDLTDKLRSAKIERMKVPRAEAETAQSPSPAAVPNAAPAAMAKTASKVTESVA